MVRLLLTKNLLVVSLLCLLLSFGDFALALSGEKTAELCITLNSSLERGRAYFLESTDKAIERVQQTNEPTQADIYILVHYLMYQERLLFESDPEQDRKRRTVIAQYFERSFGKGGWELEGCMPVKVLIGFARAPVPLPTQRKYERFYQEQIVEHWGSSGVGECFSDKIDRTYGGTIPFQCTGPKDELEIKLAYYLAVDATRPEDSPLKEANIAYASEPTRKVLRGWWDIIPETWVLMTYVEQKRPYVSKKRAMVALQNIEDTIQRVQKSTDKRQQSRIDLLLYSFLLGKSEFDERAAWLTERLLAQQLDDGGFRPMEIQHPPGHDVRATPTYFGLLALNEANKVLKCSP